MNRIWYLLLLLVWVAGCASDDCADGKCNEVEEPEWGSSWLYAFEPENGEVRWWGELGGESIEIYGKQSNIAAVVVGLNDPCFDEESMFVIGLGGGYEVQDATPDVEPNSIPDSIDDTCTGVEVSDAPAAHSFQYLNGLCVGLIPSSGALVAVDPTNGEEKWRNELGASVHNVFGNVLIAEAQVSVTDLVRNRLYRIAVSNGAIIWQYEQVKRMTALGANSEFLFLVDSEPFALELTTGDLGWRSEESLKFVFGQDEGVLMNNTLLITREYSPESTCVQ